MTITKSLFAAATAVALVAGSASADTWRAWNIHNDGHPNTAAMDKFAELIDVATGGEITLDVFHGGCLAHSQMRLSRYALVRSKLATSTLVQSARW